MSARQKRRQPVDVVLTDRAVSDIRGIESSSVVQWGRKTADKYLADIEAALDRLAEHPGLLRLEPSFSPELYFYRVAKHVLVCDLSGDRLTVLTLVHTSMDLPTRLAELEPQLAAEAAMLHRTLHDRSAAE